jgi:hypothetical protein
MSTRTKTQEKSGVLKRKVEKKETEEKMDRQVGIGEPDC